MAVFVKICGICSEGDLEQISALSPDALGFVFWGKSKRAVDPTLVERWKTNSSIRRVGVFVDPSPEELYTIVKTARLDVIQLHKTTRNWDVDRLRLPEHVEIWKAMTLDEMKGSMDSFCFDRYLIDSFDPKTIGGTGMTCDWVRAREMVVESKKPILLAGGLRPSNVGEAIKMVSPWGVDVSSGVELSSRAKDLEKVAAFISAARAKE